MAENKKSFILYADIVSLVDDLPREIKGDLFQLILDYVNDRNPEPTELLLKTAFAPIKAQLKRDLIKWETIRGKRSDAGKASANKRQQVSTSVESVEQNQQVSTVSVTVNDTVTVNVNDNVIYPVKKVEEMFFKEVSLIEYTCREKSCSEEISRKYMQKFWDKQKAANKISTRSYSDFKSHYINSVPTLSLNGKQSDDKEGVFKSKAI